MLVIGSRGRVRAGAVLVVALLTQFFITSVTSAPAQTASEITGSWSAPIDLGITGVHTAVMPTGKVLLVSRKAVTMGPLARLWNPADGTTTNVSHPTASRDIYCASHSFLADGRLLFTGGNLRVGAKDGVKLADIFSGSSQEWSPAPPLGQARWYPTSIELGDGRVLIFGGHQKEGTWAKRVESYNKLATARTLLPTSATRNVGLYPRLHLLPSGKLFYSGVTTDPLGSASRLFDPGTNTWSPVVDNVNFGKRGDGMSVLLPGLQKVLAMGGSSVEKGTATASAEIIDLSDSAPQWRTIAPMNHARKHSNSVLLPDGKLLVVGGAFGPGNYEQPVKVAEMFDPATETWTDMAAQVAPRTHHSTAVLLPDGRVLSAGDDRGTDMNTGELYSPPYLFKGPRPTISSVPASVNYGQQFSVGTPDASQIGRAVLVRAPAVTHSYAFDQRNVQLSFTSNASSLIVSAPSGGNIAPPGHYMLFILNSDGVPSVASWIHIS